MKKQTSFVQKTENKIARWSDNKKTLVGCAIVGSLWTSLGAATLLCWSNSKETSTINQKTSVVRQNIICPQRAMPLQSKQIQTR